MNLSKLDAFTAAYVEAALWSSFTEDGTPLDQTEHELAQETWDKMITDCKAFRDANAGLIFVSDNLKIVGDPESRAGHDFWLTRCGHGAGFWDGDWHEPAASVLTKASKAFGNVDLYVGDDGLIYQF